MAVDQPLVFREFLVETENRSVQDNLLARHSDISIEINIHLVLAFE